MENITSRKKVKNVGVVERVVSGVGAAGLMVFTLAKSGRSRIPAALGGGYLLYRAITGRDPVYSALGIQRNGGTGGIQVRHTMTIYRPRAEVYAFWRNFENLPRFMQHLKAVHVNHSEGREISHWVARAPLGMQVEWKAELVEDRPNEVISWRSMADSQIENRGIVHFKDALADMGTEVDVLLFYRPPAGSLGAAFAKLLGEEPDIQVKQDLKRFKQIMETGEISTTYGQTSGRLPMVEKQREQLEMHRQGG